MDNILSFLSGGNIGNIIAQLITLALGVGSVSAIIIKWLKPVKEVAELMNTIVESFADGKLSEEEIKRIIKEAKDIPASIASLKGNVKT